MLKAQGPSSSPMFEEIVVNHWRRSSNVRALGPGNEPMIPALHAAMTISGPDTRNIGAAIAGSAIRDLILSNLLVIRVLYLVYGRKGP